MNRRGLPPFSAVLLVLCAGACESTGSLTERLARADGRRLRHHVEVLSAIGPRPGFGKARPTQRTLAYIVRELRRYGYRPGEERFRVGGHNRIYRNILATKPGSGPQASKIIEIGAHYDTVRVSPGADDNASGVACVLEAARLLAREKCNKTVRFCFFALEERGLIGSRIHARGIRRRQEQVEGAIILDCIAYADHDPGSQKSPAWIPFVLWPPSAGNFITLAGDLPSGFIGDRFESAVKRYVPELPHYNVKRSARLFPDSARSDHYNYWVAGIPAVLLTDTAPFRNPHYHKPTDTPDTLDYTFLKRVTTAVIATLMDWAEIAVPGTAVPLEPEPTIALQP